MPSIRGTGLCATPWSWTASLLTPKRSLGGEAYKIKKTTRITSSFVSSSVLKQAPCWFYQWGKWGEKVSCPRGNCTCPGRADGFFFRALSYCYKRNRRSNGRLTHTTYSSSYPSSSGSPVLGSQSFTTNFNVFVNVQVTEERNKEVTGKTMAAATLTPRTHASTPSSKFKFSKFISIRFL